MCKQLSWAESLYWTTSLGGWSYEETRQYAYELNCVYVVFTWLKSSCCEIAWAGRHKPMLPIPTRCNGLILRWLGAEVGKFCRGKGYGSLSRKGYIDRSTHRTGKYEGDFSVRRYHFRATAKPFPSMSSQGSHRRHKLNNHHSLALYLRF